MGNVAAVKNTRGNNQSADTKFATLLVDDAITFIETGRIHKGVELLIRALTLLPDFGLDRQIEAEKARQAFRGFE